VGKPVALLLQLDGKAVATRLGALTVCLSADRIDAFFTGHLSPMPQHLFSGQRLTFLQGNQASDRLGILRGGGLLQVVWLIRRTFFFLSTLLLVGIHVR
jgi:hypothetical protein